MKATPSQTDGLQLRMPSSDWAAKHRVGWETGGQVLRARTTFAQEQIGNHRPLIIIELQTIH